MDINEAAVSIHATARNHGFWDKERNFGEMLMLVTSELAEALEEDREGMSTVYFKCKACGYTDQDHNDVVHYIPTEHGLVKQVLAHLGFWTVPEVRCSERLLKPEGALVELIDAIIRLLDTAQHYASRTPFSVAYVMNLKMEYNDSREYMHGKAY